MCKKKRIDTQSIRYDINVITKRKIILYIKALEKCKQYYKKLNTHRTIGRPLQGYRII